MTLIVMAITAYCLFGFLTSFEIPDSSGIRLIYGTIIVVAQLTLGVVTYKLVKGSKTGA
jgi:hypothetical protein